MSSSRVNPYPMPDLLAALEQLQQQQSNATLELASGSSINKPSDNPAGAAQLARIDDLSSQVDSYQTSLSSLSGQFSTADSTLDSVVTVLQRAVSLGVAGANGTLSDTDRASVVTELTGIQSQLLSLANTSYQGQYIFAGTATTQPFVVDPSQASGVRYAGNNGTNNVTIGSGYQLQVNLPGSQIFNGPGADVFLAINNLITSMQSDTGISTAVTALGTALTYVSGQQVFYGNALNQTQSQQTYLSTQSLGLSQQENTIGAADLAAVATQVENDEIATSATLAAIGKMPQTSLFDYLK
ncbi:MAG: flagellar hook-associated protein FlgL [Terriglobales bacterium]